MRSINPKCTNDESFKYLILISLHYYDLKHHLERINQLKRYENRYIFKTNNYIAFENNNLSISLNVYNEYGDLLQRATNSTNNIPYKLKIIFSKGACKIQYFLLLYLFIKITVSKFKTFKYDIDVNNNIIACSY